jgi:Flp pilus assembly protein TadB
VIGRLIGGVLGIRYASRMAGYQQAQLATQLHLAKIEAQRMQNEWDAMTPEQQARVAHAHAERKREAADQERARREAGSKLWEDRGYAVGHAAGYAVGSVVRIVMSRWFGTFVIVWAAILLLAFLAVR